MARFYIRGKAAGSPAPLWFTVADNGKFRTISAVTTPLLAEAFTREEVGIVMSMVKVSRSFSEAYAVPAESLTILSNDMLKSLNLANGV